MNHYPRLCAKCGAKMLGMPSGERCGECIFKEQQRSKLINAFGESK